MHMWPMQLSVLNRFGLLFVLFCALSIDVLACPGCKDGFASGPNSSIGEAYSWSILFMLGVPATIITVFTIVLVRRLKQNPNG